jgi:GTP-binding protein HflX
LEQAESPGPTGQERFVVSARTGEGIQGLLVAVEERLTGDRPVFQVVVDPSDGAGLAWLYSHAEVLDRDDSPDDGLHLTVRVAGKNHDAFLARYHLAEDGGRP